MAVYNLVYFSKATREFTKQELKALGEFAEANNKACGITGILL